jgi:hypothetical protein
MNAVGGVLITGTLLEIHRDHAAALAKVHAAVHIVGRRQAETIEVVRRTLAKK